MLYKFLKLKLIKPVQLPLHEPYFDFTLIIATHTKNPVLTSKTYTFTYLVQIKQTYCVYYFQHVTSG